MKKKIITSSIILICIAAPILFLSLTVKNSVDCSQLVIDSYELHSNINIPKVDYVNCYYDKDINSRISIYDLKKDIDLERFLPIDDAVENYLKASELLAVNEQPKNENLHIATGEKWGRKWTYLIDQESNRLWVELNYN